MIRVPSIVAAIAALAVSAAPASAGLLSSPLGTAAQPAHVGSGIIMRPGGVCDPIRHMGC